MFRRFSQFIVLIPLLFILNLPTSLYALDSKVNGKIIAQKLNAQREGYTVLSVWGTYREMGYAQGYLLAKDIDGIVRQFKILLGTKYSMLSTVIANTVWKPVGVEEEIDGMVAGIKAVIPNSLVTKMDIKLYNTYGDWSYACRSHSAWGSFVSGKTKTLSTRRLDFNLPSSIQGIRHHVLVARQPANGGVRWVNFGWAGLVIAVTAVNEYGTLVSLHDYFSKATIGKHMPRSVATRYVLTLVKDLPVAQHLDAAFKALQKETITTGTFINCYVPEGLGGVFTCQSGKACHKKRVPQKAFHNGNVIMTTNNETDGKTAPPDDSFMNAYYNKGGVKTLADHYGLMGHHGMHLFSLAFRKRGDMTIWAEGRLSSGVTPTIKIEFTDLFSNTTQPQEYQPSLENIGQDASPTSDNNPTIKESKILQEVGNKHDDLPDSSNNEQTTTKSGCNCQQNQTTFPLFSLLLLLFLFLSLKHRHTIKIKN